MVAPRAWPILLNCKNEHLVPALGAGTAAQAAVGLYRLGVSQAEKTKKSGDERQQPRAPYRTPQTSSSDHLSETT